MLAPSFGLLRPNLGFDFVTREPQRQSSGVCLCVPRQLSEGTCQLSHRRNGSKTGGWGHLGSG